ncbi:MAG: phenylacetate-CoA oxygenase subunit PaaC [Hyphomicrobiaceae bacterium]|nr:phenylacetate-CoA oxygenase subunit PaaC [Hyphomicrobiaceae bacterium]
MRPSADPINPDRRAAWLIRLGDDALMLGHRLSEWSSRAPTLEEDIALSNLALDLIGQTRAFYQHACKLEGGMRDEDGLAFRRSEHEFRNVQLVEQLNGNFADTIVRHVLFSAFAYPFHRALSRSHDPEVAGIAARAGNEMAYHLRHSGEWLIRLGDGTAESHAKAQAALDMLWPYVDELFASDALDREMAESGFGADPAQVRPAFDSAVERVLSEATLERPPAAPGHRGGRDGVHTEHLGHLLAQMQYLQRAHPGASW